MEEDEIFRRILETMARASVGETAARVDMENASDLGNPLVRIGHALNVLLSDIDFQRAEAAAATMRAHEEQTRRLREVERAAHLLDLGDPFFELETDWRIVRVNANMERLTHTARTDMLDRICWELWPDTATRDSPYWREYHHCMEERVPVNFEAFHPLIKIWTSVTAYPTSTGGIAVFMRDVSQRRQTEEALSASTEALRKSEEQLLHAQKMDAIGRLAGGIAHDFNNLLTIILGCTTLALERLSPGDPGAADLKDVVSAGERASELTRRLLAFSRKQVLQPKVIDLNRTVRDIEPMVTRILGEDIDVVFSLSRLLGTCFADPGQVEQVIMNLVVNARDAMPAGGRLAIETANIDLDAADAEPHPDARPGPYVKLAVSDNGHGMDQATVARVFEPFFTTKDKSKGTGLGLSTVFGIVAQSGGHISVSSELRKGTTFTICLPRVDRPADVIDSLAPESKPLDGTETILVAEDDDQVRRLLTTTLRRHGYSVLEAQNAGEAFLIAEKNNAAIHLLVTDVVMPRLTGRELAERLVADRPEMKVLYVSGYAESMIHTELLKPSAAFLAKPITPTAFASKVREVLDAPTI